MGYLAEMRRRARKADVRTGFTLVELLVVITIIAVAAGILLPVFARVRAKARQTVCAANLRQLGLAVKMYAQDNDGFFPPYSNAYPGADCHLQLPPGGSNNWITDYVVCSPRHLLGALMPYVHDLQVWYCPEDTAAGRRVEQWRVDHEFSSYYFAFWADNHGLFALGRDDGTLVSPRGTTRVPDAWIASDPNGYYMQACSALTPPAPPAGGEHFRGVNICYIDGRVKWMQPSCP